MLLVVVDLLYVDTGSEIVILQLIVHCQGQITRVGQGECNARTTGEERGGEKYVKSMQEYFLCKTVRTYFHVVQCNTRCPLAIFFVSAFLVLDGLQIISGTR